jgi:copper(I)-binding protein
MVDGITITNARLVLNAVKANPAVVYFDLAYEGDKGLSIRKADVDGAGMAMMHDYVEYDYKMQMTDALPVALTKGTQVSFKPGGLHIMAMEPSPDWGTGRQGEGDVDDVGRRDPCVRGGYPCAGG